MRYLKIYEEFREEPEELDRQEDKDVWWQENSDKLIDVVSELDRDEWLAYLDDDEDLVDATLDSTAKHKAQTLFHAMTIADLDDIINNEGIEPAHEEISEDTNFRGTFRPIFDNNEEDMEVSENPDFEKSVAVLNLSNTKDDTIVKSINQTQFNATGAIRFKDLDGIEKPGGDGRNNPFFKSPNEEYPIKDVPNGLVITYMGTSYRVVSKS